MRYRGTRWSSSDAILCGKCNVLASTCSARRLPAARTWPSSLATCLSTCRSVSTRRYYSTSSAKVIWTTMSTFEKLDESIKANQMKRCSTWGWLLCFNVWRYRKQVLIDRSDLLRVRFDGDDVPQLWRRCPSLLHAKGRHIRGPGSIWYNYFYQ